MFSSLTLLLIPKKLIQLTWKNPSWIIYPMRKENIPRLHRCIPYSYWFSTICLRDGHKLSANVNKISMVRIINDKMLLNLFKILDGLSEFTIEWWLEGRWYYPSSLNLQKKSYKRIYKVWNLVSILSNQEQLTLFPYYYLLPIYTRDQKSLRG